MDPGGVGAEREQPPGKFYRLTAAGRRELAKKMKSWTRFAQALDRVIEAAFGKGRGGSHERDAEPATLPAVPDERSQG